MGANEIREPIQKRSIEKKEKIIKAGFELICKNGYHNTNTAQIAKEAGVSTGIIYQYFKDKHDIFICGLEKYADNIFFPMINLENLKFNKTNLPKIIKKIIDTYISDHKLSQSTHEEIMAMIHSDKDVAHFYYNRELKVTYYISNILKNNNLDIKNLNERVHIMIGMIDNLCHEIIYHQHKDINYTKMTNIVIDNIVNMFQ